MLLLGAPEPLRLCAQRLSEVANELYFGAGGLASCTHDPRRVLAQPDANFAVLPNTAESVFGIAREIRAPDDREEKKASSDAGGHQGTEKRGRSAPALRGGLSLVNFRG